MITRVGRGPKKSKLYVSRSNSGVLYIKISGIGVFYVFGGL